MTFSLGAEAPVWLCLTAPGSSPDCPTGHGGGHKYPRDRKPAAVLNVLRPDGKVTIAEAVKATDVPINTLTWWVRSGKIKAEKVGHYRFVRLADVKKMIRRRAE